MNYTYQLCDKVDVTQTWSGNSLYILSRNRLVLHPAARALKEEIAAQITPLDEAITRNVKSYTLELDFQAPCQFWKNKKGGWRRKDVSNLAKPLTNCSLANLPSLGTLVGSSVETSTLMMFPPLLYA